MLHLPDADPLLTLAVVLVAGVLSGRLARKVGLPGVTGQILAGLLLGPFLGVFEEQSVRGLQPLTHFALALMAVTVGAHFNLKRMRNAGKRLALLFLAEATITPALVLVALAWVPGVSWPLALLLAAIAVSTAPATIVALVKETRSRGLLVKTLVAAVALDNVACILLCELARSLLGAGLGNGPPPGVREFVLGPGQQLLLAAGIGGAAALTMQLVRRLIVRPEAVSTAGVLAILMTSGLADYLEASPLLACLFLGFVQTNLTPSRDELVDALFSNFEPAILAIFFTLAGMELELGAASAAGLAGIAYFLARAAGKLTAARLAMTLAGATSKVRRYLGMTLLPQAGLAIGLVLLVGEDPAVQDNPGFQQMLLAVVLSVVTLNELVGPVLARHALRRAGEAGGDRSRLLDFLQEENIVTDLQARSKEEAIGKLVDHMIRSHHLQIDGQTLLHGVLEREGKGSTCLGGGLAVPHAILPEGHAMVGVIGLSRAGLSLETPDQRPVHCMVLLGTCERERERHLQVLATLARTIGLDAALQDRLFNASSPAHAAEVLHGEESESFNVFLGDRT